MLLEEIVPALGDRIVEGEAFVASVLERFRNPFLDHRLADIAVEHERKLAPPARDYVSGPRAAFSGDRRVGWARCWSRKECSHESRHATGARAVRIDHDLPEEREPGPAEALVAVRRVGVCGTDLHAFHGRQPFFSYPRILGHELGVEVLAVGSAVTHVRAGDRCALRPYLECGSCDACLTRTAQLLHRARGAWCACGRRDEGALVVPADHLHPSAVLSYDQLALVETLSIGGHAVVRGAPVAGERTLVIGAGPIGLAVSRSLIDAGVEPVLCDMQS